jgi:hypothetical protein
MGAIEKELDQLERIVNNAYNGNWSDAINEYKTLNLSPQDFMAKLEIIQDKYVDNIYKDMTLIGFYSRCK